MVEANRERTFADAAEQFLREFPVITDGQRNEQYVEGHGRRIRKHLNPFFGDKPLSKVTSGLVQEYRIHRTTSTKDATGKPPGA